MNRKDGGKGGRTREGALSWSPQLEPGRKLPGTGAGRRQARLEARRERRQGGNGGKEERGKEEAIFGVFLVKREKKRDNCLISNKNH